MLTEWKLLLIFIALQVHADEDWCHPKIFDCRFYLWHNVRLLGYYSNCESACSHWSMHGIREGRIANILFHSRQYCVNYPEAEFCQSRPALDFFNAAKHYLDGEGEEREGYVTTGYGKYWVIANDKIALMVCTTFGGAISSIVYEKTETLISSGKRDTNVQVYFYYSRNGVAFQAREGGVYHDLYDDDISSTNITSIGAVPNSELLVESRLKSYYEFEDSITLKKRIKINVNDNPNLISYEVKFEMHSDYERMSAFVPGMNLVTEYDKLYQVDADSHTCHPIDFPVPDSANRYSTKPLIFAKSDSVAIGALVSEIEGPKGAVHYIYNGPLDIGSNLTGRVFLGPLYEAADGATAGTVVKVKTYIAIGTLEEVTRILSELQVTYVPT